MTSKHLFEFDKSFNRPIVGTDEAGRGPAAGGVYAAAVEFEKVTEGLIKDLSILNDSKKLTAKKRESIFDLIKNNTRNQIICVEVEEIEKINILNASLKAMNIACTNVIDDVIKLNGLTPHPALRATLSHKGRGEETTMLDHSYMHSTSHKEQGENVLVLVDGNKLIKNFGYEQQFVIKGDSKSASIAAASILAKVSRDRYMQQLHEEFPMYNWAKNAGYLTKEHLDAIDKYGLCKYHRPSFLKKHFLKQKTEVSIS